jgi:hypothetical protein
MANIIEYIREEAIKDIFKMGSFSRVWPTWKSKINRILGGNFNESDLINLGDSLAGIFSTTRTGGRSQGSLSGGGNAWGALVCWYLNVCLVGSRGVVLKQRRRLVPDPIREAVTVNYGTFPSNTESDLISIIFPDKNNFSVDKGQIVVTQRGATIPTVRGRGFNYKEIINALVHDDFDKIIVGITQCKTNWNDNAQIPMLWDIVYSAVSFGNRQISVGNSAYQLTGLKKFNYSFATVPTSRGPFKPDSTRVMRVKDLSGGNYWGNRTVSGVANSIKEIFGKNFTGAFSSGHSQINVLRSQIPNLGTTYGYFDLV